MKKKILAMVLSLAMCCSMTACGSANKDTATSDGASSDKKAASKNDNGSDLSYIPVSYTHLTLPTNSLV